MKTTRRPEDETRIFAKLGLRPDEARAQAPSVAAYVGAVVEGKRLEPRPFDADALEAAQRDLRELAIGAALSNVLARLTAERPSAKERRLGQSVQQWARQLRISPSELGEASLVQFLHTLNALRGELRHNSTLSVISDLDRALRVATEALAQRPEPIPSEEHLLARANRERDALVLDEREKGNVLQEHGRAVPMLVGQELEATDVAYAKRAETLDSLERLGGMLARLRKCTRGLSLLVRLSEREVPGRLRKLERLRLRADHVARHTSRACAATITAYNALLSNTLLCGTLEPLPTLPRLSADPSLETPRRSDDSALAEVLADAVFRGQQFPESDTHTAHRWVKGLTERVDRHTQIHEAEYALLLDEQRLDQSAYAHRYLHRATAWLGKSRPGR